MVRLRAVLNHAHAWDVQKRQGGAVRLGCQSAASALPQASNHFNAILNNYEPLSYHTSCYLRRGDAVSQIAVSEVTDPPSHAAAGSRLGFLGFTLPAGTFSSLSSFAFCLEFAFSCYRGLFHCEIKQCMLLFLFPPFYFS